MRAVAQLFAFFVCCATANAANACVIIPDERSPSEIRANSRPVAVDRQCRTINAGVYDDMTLGPNVNLGNGRVQQVLDGADQSLVLVADCNTREVTMLQGPVTAVYEGDSCGPYSTFADLAGDNAIMSLAVGANLHELVELAAARGVKEVDPLEYFFKFSKPYAFTHELYDVSGKDRFDLLCGCKSFYPDSPGAQN